MAGHATTLRFIGRVDKAPATDDPLLDAGSGSAGDRRLVWQRAFIAHPYDELSPIEYALIYNDTQLPERSRWPWAVRLKVGAKLTGHAASKQAAADKAKEAWWQVYSKDASRLLWVRSDSDDYFRNFRLVARPANPNSRFREAAVVHHEHGPKLHQWSWSLHTNDDVTRRSICGSMSQQDAINEVTKAYLELISPAAR